MIAVLAAKPQPDEAIAEVDSTLQGLLAGTTLPVSLPLVKKPRPHQIEALDRIDAALATYNRAKVIKACGTGKTLTELWTIERRDARLSIVFFPSLGLLSQTFREWRAQQAGPIPFRHICVCSDETVDAPGVEGDVEGLRGDHIHLDPLTEHFKACTDPAEVRRFLMAASAFQGGKGVPRSIVFCTYASAPVVALAMRNMPSMGDARAPFDLRPFDLGIFDEAHKTVGAEGKRNAFALEDANLPIAERLFFTATQKIVTAAATPEDPGASRVISMDDHSLYGDVAYQLGFAKAARRGLITRFQVVASFVNDASLTPEELASPDARRIADTRALQLAMNELDARKAITFHSRVDEAMTFARSIGAPSAAGHGHESTRMPAFHVNGDMKSAERDHLLASFGKAESGVMTNATCLTEGIDVPTVDMVAFMDPRQDVVGIAQAAGRAMRTSPGKDIGYILVPLRVDLAGAETVEQAIDRGNFHQIMRVLRALTENDDAEESWATRVRGALEGNADNPPLLKLMGFGGPNAPSSADVERIREAISTRILFGDDDERFEQWARELETFKAVNGHCDVPQSYPGGLGKWAGNQRSRAKTPGYREDRRSRLESLGFNFQLDHLEQAFQKGFSRWKAFKDANGREPVQSSKDPEESKIGHWVSALRCLAKRHNFQDERRAQLDALGFVWVVRDPVATEVAKLVELEVFRKEHGHCDVPAKYRGGLGRWVRRQRFDARLPGYPEELRARLNAMGFSWSYQDGITERRLEELVAFKRTHGHCNVAGSYPGGLGVWVIHQRSSARKFGYSEELRSRLNEMGFVWNPLNDNGSRRFEELAAFKKEHGHCRVPQNYPGGLGAWVAQQRARAKKPGYPDERRAELDAMGFEWAFSGAAAEQQWFEELEAFKKVNGHCNVPVSYPGGLGKWVNRQRTTAKDSDYPESRRVRLDALGFSWSFRDAVLERWVEELAEFKRKHGHCSVPKDHPGGLGIWVMNQRVAARKPGYSHERRARLDAMGFVWGFRASQDKSAELGLDPILQIIQMEPIRNGVPQPECAVAEESVSCADEYDDSSGESPSDVDSPS